ncbi:hypothetical protein N7517_006309 [Penicillium concentricum]|uniref:Xylanolytic transcriptional activator regulatory domain-containing protein n=1 Tax=Penicillium concentricum TaxID=293559 RepID=A0A9W9V9W0_9EURO|nr:uncharacterized protein N7517_006309 [Penicillium concentricum]KAJ5374303.1 hypothetical protein N7517_006309 [Penicillium concentricum]
MSKSTGKINKRTSAACDSCFAKKGHRMLLSDLTVVLSRSNAMTLCLGATGACIMAFPVPLQESYGLRERKLQSIDISSDGAGIGAVCEPSRVEHGPPPLLGEWYFAGIKLGGISRHNGIPFFSVEGLRWLESRCGQNKNLDRFARFFHSWGTNPRSTSDSLGPGDNQDYSQLPDREIIEAYLASFQSSALHQIFPLVKYSLFIETIRRAYQRPQDSSESLSEVSCVYAFAAFVTTIDLRNSTLPAIDGNDCAKEAQRLLSKLSQTPTTLDALQTVMILCAFRLLSGDLSSADILLAIAVRLLFQLGGNQFADPNASEERDQVRTLFWLCYNIDKCLFLRTGRPPSIHDDDCDLTLPSNYIARTSEGRFETEETMDCSSPFFPCDLRLSMLISNIYRELYSVRGLQKSDADVLMTIRKLDNDLEAWRMSIPSQKMPRSSASDSSSIRMLEIRFLMNRLEYHQCMGILHQASSRCKSWNEDIHGMYEGINSSLALAVEASRSSLLYLNLMQGTLDEETAWFAMFYPISAIMTLFCYILLKPQDPRAADDLHLLTKVPVVMQAALGHRSGSIEPMQVQFVEDFVEDLSHLAMSAIDRDRFSQPEYC